MFTVQKYSQWKDTADTMHMLLQMMGKVMLRWMPSQPEWNHALLDITPEGFTTGLIPRGIHSFDIAFSVLESTVAVRCTSGRSASFPVRGKRSIADYYHELMHILTAIGHETEINKIPQEYYDTTPFDEQTEPHEYDVGAARNYFDSSVFVHNALLTFAAPLRSKKILPRMFWGTFDMTTVIFAGEDRPFPGKGLIEKVAFDEQFVEFGYWPGDVNADDPALFVLPYPFLTKDLTGAKVSPKEAFYSPEKKEFFLPLKDVVTKDDPSETVKQFCKDAFDVIAREENWKDYDWYTKPLLC